jgi:multiple antibiotic resistance protein
LIVAETALVAFASLTSGDPPQSRMAAAFKGTVIATIILLVFAVFGEAVLRLFGISLPALRIAGGVLLLLIAIDMVFARASGGVSTTAAENAEAAVRADISVFPLATPLIAGPGAMGAIILLMADAAGHPLAIALVIGALIAVLALTLACLLLTAQLQKLLGQTGVHVVTRIFGVILAALAVQFMLDGLAGSELFNLMR